jgi:hypothetical protein
MPTIMPLNAEEKPAEKDPEALVETKPEDNDAQKAKLAEESRKLTADLLTSKKYNLPIKEKRFKPLISFSLGLPAVLNIKRLARIPSKKEVNSSLSAATEVVKPTAKLPKRKSLLFMLVGVVAILFVGGFVAVDSGAINLGFKLPVRIFGKSSSAKKADVGSIVSTDTLSNSQGKLLLPKSGIRFTYDPKVFTLVADDGVGHDGVYAALIPTGQTAATATSDVSISEFPGRDTSTILGCAKDASCTNNISDFTAIKLDNVKKQDLYLVTYIRKTVQSTTTLFSPLTSISMAAKPEDLNDPEKRIISIKDDKGVNTTLAMSIFMGTEGLNYKLQSIESARAYLNSDDFLKYGQVLLSASDQ